MDDRCAQARGRARGRGRPRAARRRRRPCREATCRRRRGRRRRRPAAARRRRRGAPPRRHRSRRARPASVGAASTPITRCPRSRRARPPRPSPQPRSRVSRPGSGRSCDEGGPVQAHVPLVVARRAHPARPRAGLGAPSARGAVRPTGYDSVSAAIRASSSAASRSLSSRPARVTRAAARAPPRCSACNRRSRERDVLSVVGGRRPPAPSGRARRARGGGRRVPDAADEAGPLQAVEHRRDRARRQARHLGEPAGGHGPLRSMTSTQRMSVRLRPSASATAWSKRSVAPCDRRISSTSSSKICAFALS